jgi:thioredoxin reductase
LFAFSVLQHQKTQIREESNMKTKLSALLCFLALSISSSWGLEYRGVVACGDWVKEKKKDSVVNAAHQAILVGFLSGIALATDKDFLRGTTNESLFLWVDNYCQKTPLENIYMAGMHLSIELQIKNKNK